MNKIVYGKELKEKKLFLLSLTNIKGIGLSRSKKILTHFNIPFTARTCDIQDKEFNSIIDYIEHMYLIENGLSNFNLNNIKRKIELNTYQGMRHKVGLPVRGQNTYSNARTRKKNRGITKFI